MMLPLCFARSEFKVAQPFFDYWLYTERIKLQRNLNGNIIMAVHLKNNYYNRGSDRGNMYTHAITVHYTLLSTY